MVTPGTCGRGKRRRRRDRRQEPGQRPTPWHFLYFRPDPQGQGSFRPTSGTAAVARPTGPPELLSPEAAGGVGATRRGGAVKRSSAPTDSGTGAGAATRRT